MIVVACCQTIKAQDYNTGIGIRGGFQQGLTIKHFTSANTALEGLLVTRWGGMFVTGLYEIHANAFDVDGLNWYYGIGGHVGFYDGSRSPYVADDLRYNSVGVDAILGMEYNIPDIPINVSIDWKPAFNILGGTGFWADNGALSVRYTF